MTTMATISLIRSIQPRTGPNSRPPNSIFGSSGASSQQFLSPQLMCGTGGAVACTVAFIMLIKYSMNSPKESKQSGNGLLLMVLFVTLIMLVAGMILIYALHRRRKSVVLVCVEPNVLYDDTENAVLAENSAIVGNPPSYDSAVAEMEKRTPDLNPPSYDNIFTV